MTIVDIIEKKKNNKELNEKEISYFVQGYTKGIIPDYQISALLMAIYLNGMSKNETVILTKEMMNSGEIIDLSSIKGIKLDKHSTGGVGDKVSLVLGPIIASCGGIVAKMSGRGLGHTGGTIDKLESIEGLNCFLSKEKFKEILKKNKLAIVGQTDDLVPADKKIYALRDVTGTVNSLPLITSSIMSKKLATGSDAILLDVKCGSGAFMKTLEDAEKLGKWMISIGKSLNKDVKVEISNMEQPLGRMIGNKNEIIEAINTLKGNGEKYFMDLIFSSASTMLMQAKIAKSTKEAKSLVEKVISNGKALKKFYEMVDAQGGNSKSIQNNNWWNPKYCKSLIAKKSGYVQITNSIIIGNAAMKLGAGRETKEDIIDYEAGIELVRTTNEHVKKNDVVMNLFSSKPIDDNLIKLLEKTLKINKEPVEVKMILKKLN